ncbi:MAG TPA: hypothetical protein VNH11_02975 [Pirellulales bacterium]|nr:hypothetical protein [Pirellulales bacterium]
MQELTSSSWRRRGCSIVWSPELLSDLIVEQDAVPLRTVLTWMASGFPDSPPGDRPTVLVGGLQTVLSTASSSSADAVYDWLRQNMLPLVRAFQSRWDRVGLVFVMDGPRQLFDYNMADDVIYFGSAGQDRAKKIKLSLGIWNGALTGDGAYELIVPDKKETGGYHVQRVS